MLTDELKSMHSRIITIVTILLGAVVIPCGIAAEPITGEAFDSLMAAQDTSCQWEFEKVFAGAVGCFVTGPLDPLLLDSSDPTSVLFSTPRVVFSSISRYEELWMRIPDRKDSVRFAKSPRMVQVAEVAGNRLGMFIEVMCDGEWKLVQLCTVHHVRHLVWLRKAVENGWFDLNEQDRIGYSKHIYRYFKWREFSRNMYINATEFDGDKTPPLAAKYNLPEQFDLLAEPPLPMYPTRAPSTLLSRCRRTVRNVVSLLRTQDYNRSIELPVEGLSWSGACPGGIHGHGLS